MHGLDNNRRFSEVPKTLDFETPNFKPVLGKDTAGLLHAVSTSSENERPTANKNGALWTRQKLTAVEIIDKR
ncbi:MAG: hypothetical protein AAFO68_10175 [Pseudomonadota bacterium]